MPAIDGTRLRRVPGGERVREKESERSDLVTCEEFDQGPRTTRRTVEEGAEV